MTTESNGFVPQKALPPRLVRRRRIVAWTLPLALFAGLIGLKLVSQHVIAEQALGAYAEDEFESAMNLSGQLEFLNVTEPWKAHYNQGTSYLRLEALDEAEDELRRALELAEPTEQCPVRANLAITLEIRGDRAQNNDDRESAKDAYLQALEVLDNADDSCEQSTSARSIEDSIERITAKLAELEPPQEKPQDPDDQDGGEGDDADPSQPIETPKTQPKDDLDDLENDMQDNQRDREDHLNDDGNYYGPKPDRPW